MRLVATVAKHALGVRHRIHLVEALGLGCVLLVAAPAKVGHIGQLGNVGSGVVGVLGQRSVTSFTGNLRVHTTTMQLGLLIVTLEALLVPGIADGAGADHFQRARPVMSVFSKVFGHYDSPDDQEHRQPRY